MDRQARSRLKNTRKMKRRSVHGTRDAVECDSIKKPACNVVFDSLGALGVIRIRAIAMAPARLALLRECGIEYVSNELQRSHVGPERFERSCHQAHLEALHDLPMPPENGGIAGTSDKRKRSIRAVVDRGIELADDVTEHSRRGDENRPAIPAFGRVADAVG